MNLILELAKKSIQDYRDNRIGLGVLVAELERIVDCSEKVKLPDATELRRLWGELEISYALDRGLDQVSCDSEISFLVNEIEKSIEIL